MNRRRKRILGFTAAVLLVLLAIAIGAIAPNFRGLYEVSKLSNAKNNLKELIEAEDWHYQKTGTYFSLEIDHDNLNVKRILGQRYTRIRGCEYAVAVSGLAFTAEVRVPIDNTNFNYLGYVRTAPGKQIGVVGEMGVCAAEGIYAGSRKLVNVIGPCYSNSWRTMGVASGNMKRLAIETLPSDANVSIDGVSLGKTTSFHGTISENYGYLFVADPPESPINVVVSKDGYSTVSFSVDWGDFTYIATVPLQANR